MPEFSVHIAKDDLAFSAAHFITFSGDTCESLHGHNYRVTAEVSGPLDENHYVIDFFALHATLLAIAGELDHGVLLPTGHRTLRVEAGPEEVEVRLAARRWVFPRSDCRLLPIADTTTELLAQYIGLRTLGELQSRLGIRPAEMRIELQQGGGLSAVWRWRAE